MSEILKRLAFVLTFFATSALAVPTVSLTSPTANQKFGAPAQIMLAATATPSSGTTITKVEFFRGGTTLIAPVTASPYKFVWTGMATGTYSITAKATDSAGGTKTTSSVSITVETNVAPTVSISSPATGTSFTSGATVNITATASDTDGTISQVEFFQGTTSLGVKTASPFTLAWVPPALGTYSLTAKATDNSGGTKTSTAVSITVLAPPTVTLTAPANNATFTAGSSISLSATASAASGTTIKQVAFFQNGTAVGSADTTSPYGVTWSSVPAGAYSLTAVATDNAGGVKTSAPVSITLHAPPTVSITAPTASQKFGLPATINVTANATPGAGSTISKVDFFTGGTTLIGTATSSPYSIAWSNPVAGTYSLTAKATDNTGSATTSSAVSITVESNVVPSVSISSPTSNTTFGGGATVTITATASDTDGTISQVEFFASSTSLGVKTASPYTLAWVPSAPGAYSLTAKATDNSGGTKTSTAVSITVLAPPTVNITAPANNASFAPPATIGITATATAASGASISKVDFFNGSTLLGTKTSSPYTFSWTSVPAGSYVLTAKATDSKGGVNTSPPVNVTVAVPHNPPTVSITSPASGTISQAPANITVTASASATSGSTLQYVDFSDGQTTIRSTTAPYSATFSSVPAGGYLLSAKAVDDVGASTTSALVYAIVDGADSCDSSPPVSAAESKTMLASYGNLPLTFERNVGQADGRVKFLARGTGYQLFLAEGESVLALRPEQGKAVSIRARFAGGDSLAEASGLEPQQNSTSYFVGNDPAHWHLNVANYAKVRYASVYPGIDAMYHSTQGKLEYDLVVAPQADPSRIRVAFEGVEDLDLDENGNLLLHTPGGTISQWKPVAYQEVDGTRREVAASYRLLADTSVAIDVGGYDKSRTLVIDPVLVYSTYLGGATNGSGATAIALSRCGEAFVTGWTWATDFPTSSGAFDNMGDANSLMGFVTKLNQSGTGLLYSTYVTGTTFGTGDSLQSTQLVAIAVDSTGHAYVAGTTNATDFPVTPGAMITAQPSDSAGVLAKLNSNGGALLYGTYLNLTSMHGVAVDGSGGAYVLSDRNVQKISADGASLAYSFQVAGSGGLGGSDMAWAIAVDPSGNAYVTGSTNTSAGFPITSGVVEMTWPSNSTGFSSGFVQKINPAGNALVFSTYFGNRGQLFPRAIALDSSQRIYIGGFSDSQGFPVQLGTSHMFNMDPDQAANQYAFASRLSADASHIDFFTWIGGLFCPSGGSTCSSGGAGATGIAVDATGNVWIAGTATSNRIPLTKPLYSTFLGTSTNPDGLVVKLNPTGTTMLFGTLLNGATTASGPPNGEFDSKVTGIQVDSIGSAYVTGWTAKTDFPTTAGAFQAGPRGSVGPSAFITKINETKDTITALAVSPTSGTLGGTETLTATVTGNSPAGSVTFMDGSTALGSIALSGNSAQLVTSSLAGGVHNLSAAYAGDAHNNPSSSTVVQLTVTSPNVPPTLTLTGIVDGAVLVANSGSVYHGLAVTANGNAAAGNTLTQLQIWLDNNETFWNEALQITVSQPWTFPDIGIGVHVIHAVLIDNNGHSTSTPFARFVVNAAGTTPPTVTMTAPANAASLQLPGPFTLSATASADTQSVTFYDNAQANITVGSAPFSGNWFNPSAGSHSLVAVAINASGARSLSNAVGVTVSSPPPPTITLTSPSNGASYYTTDVIPLAATATGNGGATVSSVDFLVDGQVLATVTTSPYTAAWTTATAGTHSITAVAHDSRAITATSSAASVNVTVPPNPTVTITSPANGASIVSPGPVSISANAVGGAGASVSRVDFFEGSNLIGSSTAAPWGFTWTNVGVGVYSLTAKATGSNNGVATSQPISLTVTQGSLGLSLDSGIDGSTVIDGVVLISGTVQAPPNSAISVNGVVGRVTTDGHFFINDVGLQPGVNSLPVVLATQDGASTTQTLSITRAGDAAFSLDVDKDSGIAPLNVHFTGESLGGTAATIEFDFDGNGTVDYTANGIDAADLTITYSTPGLNLAIVRFKDANGTVLYTATKMIHVYDAVEHFNMLRNVYSQMLARLKGGDMNNALNALTSDASSKFQPVFAAIGSNLATVVDQLGTIDHANVTGDFAELVLVRAEAGQKYAYTIYLIRGPDGIWRIDGM